MKSHRNPLEQCNFERFQGSVPKRAVGKRSIFLFGALKSPRKKPGEGMLVLGGGGVLCSLKSGKVSVWFHFIMAGK